MTYGKRPPLDEQKSLWEATLAAEGVTTVAGNIGGTSFTDAGLAGAGVGSFISMMAIIYPGQPRLVDSRDIIGFDNVSGEVSVATAFKGGQVPIGTPYKIITSRFTIAEVAALTTMVQTGQYYDRVFFDSFSGIAGTAWPIGTPQVPSDVIADVITMCTNRNLKVIDVHGLLTLGDTMEHYTFIGHRHEAIADTLALAGQDVDESIIIGCLVSGAQGGTGFLSLMNCVVYLLTDFQGIANYCDLYGSAMSLKDGGFQDLHHCNSVHSDLTITVNAPNRASFKEMAGNCTFTAQDGGVLYIRGYKGTLVIDAMTDGACDIYANGADITINANCIGTGVINIYGNARVTDAHGAGTTVNDYTKETQLDAIEAVTDNLPDAGALTTIQADLTTLETRLSATRAGYLDNIDTKAMGRAQIVVEPLDLDSTAIGTYNTLIGTTQNVIIESLIFRCTRDLSGDAGFTGISLQTDDATNQVFVSQENGVKANLTAHSQLAWTGAILLRVGQYIDFSVYGGAVANLESLCDIVVTYRAVVAGGYLA